MSVIKKLLRPILGKPHRLWLKAKADRKALKEISFLHQMTNERNKQRIWYFGPTINLNLGDRAQVYCIRRWIKENYPDSETYELSVPTIINPKSHFLDLFKRIYSPDDIIIFQSGYNVNDMGAPSPTMHRMILENFPNAKIVMMPESIYYHSEENKRRDAQFYGLGRHFLFLTRDSKSYEILKDMCPNLPNRAFPDIVTTLIGAYSFPDDKVRKGRVCLCRRDDNEKYYSDDDIGRMAQQIESLGLKLTLTDTTIKADPVDFNNRLQWYIERVIQDFSTYECVVTDRFHGVVFSLVAGTPVVVIKTNNHKVTQALEWFKGVYDDYVFLADNLDDAVEKVRQLRKVSFDHNMKPYFKEHYYDRLKGYVDEVFYNKG